jgi:ATP-dependent protease ClpP protease subunit
MNWYNITKTDTTALVSLHGWIGCGGVGAEDFARELGDAQRVELFVDCHGGDTTTSLKVYNLLKGRTPLATITGNCCSAAVFAMMAAERIVAFEDTRLLVHSPTAFVLGNCAELRNEAELLAKTVQRVAAVIQKRTRQPADTVLEWLRKDTWFDATSALAAGLVDAVIPRPAQRAQPATVTAQTATSGPTDDEELFDHFLTAFGAIEVRSQETFMRELYAWATINTTEL